MNYITSQEALKCISLLTGYCEDPDVTYKSMHAMMVADPIEEVSCDYFYIVHGTDANGRQKPKKKNILVFSISAVERLEAASNLVNEVFCDINAVTLAYPYFGGSFAKFEKRKNAKGKLNYCGVGVSFTSTAALEQFLNYLASGDELNNLFDGYYLNYRKISNIECLFKNEDAFLSLLTAVDKHFCGVIPFLEKKAFHVVTNSIVSQVYQYLRLLAPDVVSMRFANSTSTIEEPHAALQDNIASCLEYIASLINLARFHVEDNTRFSLGYLENEYGEKLRHYCLIKETLDAMGLYLLIQVERSEFKCRTSLLRKLYKVPEGLFSLQQLSFCLGVQEKSLTPFLKRYEIDGVLIKDTMKTHKDYGSQRKFLPAVSFSYLLSAVDRQ